MSTMPPLPRPDTHCWDTDTEKDVWSHSPDQMRAYARAALAQRRERLTDEQIRREKPVCADFVSFRAGVRCAERIHEVSK